MLLNRLFQCRFFLALYNPCLILSSKNYSTLPRNTFSSQKRAFPTLKDKSILKIPYLPAPKKLLGNLKNHNSQGSKKNIEYIQKNVAFVLQIIAERTQGVPLPVVQEGPTKTNPATAQLDNNRQNVQKLTSIPKKGKLPNAYENVKYLQLSGIFLGQTRSSSHLRFAGSPDWSGFRFSGWFLTPVYILSILNPRSGLRYFFQDQFSPLLFLFFRKSSGCSFEIGIY